MKQKNEYQNSKENFKMENGWCERISNMARVNDIRQNDLVNEKKNGKNQY